MCPPIASALYSSITCSQRCFSTMILLPLGCFQSTRYNAWSMTLKSSDWPMICWTLFKDSGNDLCSRCFTVLDISSSFLCSVAKSDLVECPCCEHILAVMTQVHSFVPTKETCISTSGGMIPPWNIPDISISIPTLQVVTDSTCASSSTVLYPDAGRYGCLDRASALVFSLEMQQYIDISPYCDTLSQWYSIDSD